MPEHEPQFRVVQLELMVPQALAPQVNGVQVHWLFVQLKSALQAPHCLVVQLLEICPQAPVPHVSGVHTH